MATPIVYLRGMMEKDDKFDDMIALKRACEKADVPYPPELVTYFGRNPDEAVYELKLFKFAVPIIGVDCGGGGLLNRSTNRSIIESLGDSEGTEDSYLYDVHLSKLPQALKTLRLEINW